MSGFDAFNIFAGVFVGFSALDGIKRDQPAWAFICAFLCALNFALAVYQPA